MACNLAGHTDRFRCTECWHKRSDLLSAAQDKRFYGLPRWRRRKWSTEMPRGRARRYCSTVSSRCQPSVASSQPTDAPEPDPEHERQSHSARTWLSLRGSEFAGCHALMPINRSTTPARFGPLCAACRLANYAAGPPLRLVYEHIKPIHPYLDVGFGISGGDPRGSKRSSEALKRQRCPLWRARQRTCAGGFHVYAKT